MLERTLCCIEPTYELLCSVGHFTWTSNLDLPMACCATILSPKSKTSMRLVTIFGTREFQALWMRAQPASDAFQGRANFTFQGTLHVPPKSCIDSILAASNHSFEDHLDCLGAMFMALLSAGFQVNLEKSCLCQKKLEFVGFWVTEAGQKPLESRVKGTMSIKALASKKHIKMFASTVSFIKNRMSDRAKLIEPLTKLTKDNANSNGKRSNRKHLTQPKLSVPSLWCSCVRKQTNLFTCMQMLATFK